MVDSGTYTPEAIARRMQIAQQLLDFSKEKPVRHWAEGLNELAKGAVGGMQFGQAEEAERKGRYDTNAAMLDALGLPAPAPYVPQYRSPIDRVASLFGGNGNAGDVPLPNPTISPLPPSAVQAPAAAPPAAPPVMPAGRPSPAPPAPAGPLPAVASPADIDEPNSDYNRSLLMGDARARLGAMLRDDAAAKGVPRPEVMPSGKVWGDREAEAAGLYEPKPGARALVAPPAPIAGPAPPPPAAPPPTSTGGALSDLPIEKRRQIGALLSNPGTAAMGQTLLAKALGESGNTDEIKEYNFSVQQHRAAGRAPPSFDEWKTGLKRAGAQNISIDQKGETAFEQAAGKHQAERFNDLAADGQTAKQMLSDLNILSDLGRNIGTGKGAEVKAVLGPYAEAAGIKIEGLSDIQAYEAIVNRVAPALRVKGSGAQSDYELKNFVKSLPTLGNTEEGNAIMKVTLDGLYQNKVRAAEIGARALSKEITRAEAEKQLRALPDPMEGYREFMKQRGKGGAAAPAKAPTQAEIEAEMKRRNMKP